MMKNFLTILTLGFLAFSTYAQNMPCGTNISPEEMEAFYQRDISAQYSLKAGNVVEVPLVYHITHKSDGTGGFTLAETFRLHCDLNERFSNAEIHFYIMDIIHHDNDSYYYMSYNGVGNTMMNNENNLNACNIFIVKEAKSGSYPVCGYSFLASGGGGPNRGGVILDIECSGPNSTTLTHEMGHYLNLPHTFNGWEGHDYYTDPIPSSQWERVDGSNCTYRGDGFCDTPPDYISDRWACTLPKTFTDPVGQIFDVDAQNYMSYSLDGCQTYFMQDQMNEMKAIPTSHRSYLSNAAPPNTTPLETPTLEYPLDNEDGSSYENLEFSWEEVPGATHYLFQLSFTSFNSVIYEKVVSSNSIVLPTLNQNSNYIWRVKAISYAAVCNEYSEGAFKTTDFLITLAKEDTKCFGTADGSATTVMNDGTISSYKWYAFNDNLQTYELKQSTTTNVIYGLVTNKYYVKVIRNNGTNSILHFTIEDVSPLEAVLGSDSLSVISTAVTGGNPPYTYYWDNGTTLFENNNPKEGKNLLNITDSEGCFISVSYFFTLKDTTKIKPIHETSSVTFYSNPVENGLIQFSFDSEEISQVPFKLFGMDGKLLKSINFDTVEGKNEIQYDLSSIPKGVYFVTVIFNNETFTSKIIL